MTSLGWLTRSLADVPTGDGWLGPGEVEVLAGLGFEKRRTDWRLGRLRQRPRWRSGWACRPAAWRSRAAPGGAPSPGSTAAATPVSLSLSHRAGRALAVVGEADSRSAATSSWSSRAARAFLNDWLAPAERALVAAPAPAGDDRWPTSLDRQGSRREGAPRGAAPRRADAVVAPDGIDSATPGWRRLAVTWADGGGHAAGWWRAEPDWVMAVASNPAPGPPRPLDD